jgi:hypothetical protein
MKTLARILILLTVPLGAPFLLVGTPRQAAGQPPNPADNPHVTRAAFDQIRWQMPSKDIESILGKGESVDYGLVLRAMGSQPCDPREPYKRVEQGLWMRWKGKDHTIFVQFGGPKVVQKPDGSYAVGPNTESALVLFITEKPPQMIGQRNVEVRDIQIYWRLGPRNGEIRHHGETHHMGP